MRFHQDHWEFADDPAGDVFAFALALGGLMFLIFAMTAGNG